MTALYGPPACPQCPGARGCHCRAGRQPLDNRRVYGEALDVAGTAVVPGLDNDVAGDPMGLNFRKAIKLGRNTRLNVSKSGISASRKAGPVTVNSRGRITIRLGKGLSWRL